MRTYDKCACIHRLLHAKGHRAPAGSLVIQASSTEAKTRFFATRCQNGIDWKPCTCCSRLPVPDRTLPKVQSMSSRLASQHSVIDARHLAAAAKIKSLRFEKSKHPFESMGCLVEDPGAGFEFLSRQAGAFRRQSQVLSRQREASKLGIRSFRWAIRGFQMAAQIDQSAARPERPAVCNARPTRQSSHQTNRVRSAIPRHPDTGTETAGLLLPYILGYVEIDHVRN